MAQKTPWQFCVHAEKKKVASFDILEYQWSGINPSYIKRFGWACGGAEPNYIQPVAPEQDMHQLPWH
jgi:hypothetical protein